MPDPEPKVICRTPSPGKQPTRIPKWKYDLIRSVILALVPADDQGLEFKLLPQLVRERLSQAERGSLGSVSWHTTTVKLDLEVRGDIQRIPGSNPQRLRRPE